jgi:hypothetical protein
VVEGLVERLCLRAPAKGGGGVGALQGGFEVHLGSCRVSHRCNSGKEIFCRMFIHAISSLSGP